MWFTFIHMNGVDNITEAPVSIMQHSSTAPQTAASRMSMRFNQHLSETVSIKTVIITLMRVGFITGLLY